MYFIKRCTFYTLIILLLASMYKDLSHGTFIESKVVINENRSEYRQDFTVIKVKLTSGDTVLSVIESVNERNLSEIDIMKFLQDFRRINPQVDTDNLKNNAYYYFPVY